MKKVMAFGSFAMIHPGHILYLSECKKFGDYLTVVVTTDKNYEKEKGKGPALNQEQRRHMVENLEMVDRAVIGYETDFFKIVDDLKPDIVALGYDARCNPIELEKKLGVKVVKVTAHTAHKTREILKR